MKLFPFQKAAVERALNAVHKSETLNRSCNLIISSPTGTGKSVMELSLMHELEQRGKSVALVTPRVEVIDSISRNAAQLGIQSKNKLFTPITYHNKLKSGEVPQTDVLLLDEAHHDLAPTWRRLPANICIIGFTATPMRGIPLETEEWRRMFSDFYEALTITEAILGGYLTNYYYFGNTIGLLDEVIGSEATMLRSAANRLNQNMGLIYDWIMRLEEWQPMQRLFACPRKESVHRLCEHFNVKGSPKKIEAIIGETRKKQRDDLIERFQAGELWLATVDVFTEGVDAPGGVYSDTTGREVIWPGANSLIDLRPTSSPVAMLQIEGRVKRCLRNAGWVSKENQELGLQKHPNPGVARFDYKPVAQIVPFTKNLIMHRTQLKELGVDLVKKDIGDGFWIYEPNLDIEIIKSVTAPEEEFELHTVTPKAMLFKRNDEEIRMEAGVDSNNNWVVNLVSPVEAPASYVLLGRDWKRTTGRCQSCDYVIIWANSTAVSYRWLEALKGNYIQGSINPTLSILLCLSVLIELDTVGIGGRGSAFNASDFRVQGLSIQQQDAINHIKRIATSGTIRNP
jgi:superfamily II DNA or RNA helicase